ncbi:hypothetical protein C6P40_001065 [Pichia californica]|uniref:Stm1-like N-terminal domain-containing protein n=1 Tax=Pichia californica TaxID=460514 RepID=A0A9P6WJR3_9ASCO|nr:hypothetical protein C6P42_000940 [[Candida] californica]KAG0688360.1 hypothetical protein C6P40_001065 [[Candida] californica]
MFNGNDVSGDEEEFIAPKEIVAPQKSTKKDGVPPKADKTKSKGGKPKSSGNEAGAKFSNKNRDSDAPKSTQRKGGKDKKFDRHSRTGRTETAKAENNRLGDEAEAQVEGEEDAEADIEAEAEEVEEKPQLRSAADFFQELESNEFYQSKSAAAPSSSINEEDLVVRVDEEFISSTAEKKLKSKAKKEKKFLDVNITVTDDYERPERPERSDFQRGSSSRKPRGGKKPTGKARTGGKPASTKKPVSQFNEQNFPSL